MSSVNVTISMNSASVMAIARPGDNPRVQIQLHPQVTLFMNEIEWNRLVEQVVPAFGKLHLVAATVGATAADTVDTKTAEAKQ
jgi:hypothetical protein